MIRRILHELFVATLLLGWLGLAGGGCTSNPTPHPGQEDTLPPDSSYTGAEKARAICEDVGGSWQESDAYCDVSLATELDGTASPGQPPESDEASRADVVEVAVAGSPLDYTFTVTIASDDESCAAYADWWEIVRFDGTLVRRSILAGPSVAEQPFTVSTGPIVVEADESLVVRAHFHPDGYAGMVMVGTAGEGFANAYLPAEFATGIEDAPPQPEACVE